AVGAVLEGGQVRPCLAVVGGQLVGVHPLGEVDQVAGAGELLHQARLGDLGDVGGVAALHAHVQDGLVVGDALGADVDAGPFGEVGQGGGEVLTLRLDPLRQDLDGRAVVLPCLGGGEVG